MSDNTVESWENTPEELRWSVWSARVWSRMNCLRRFSPQWPTVSRPGLLKMDADLVSCLSPTFPSTSLTYSTLLFSPSTQLQFHLFGMGYALHISKCWDSWCFSRPSSPKAHFLGPGPGCGLWPESQPGGSRNPVAGGFLTGAEFPFSLGRPPKEATP